MIWIRRESCEHNQTWFTSDSTRESINVTLYSIAMHKITSLKRIDDFLMKEFMPHMYRCCVVELFKRELKTRIDSYLAELNSSLDSGKDWESRFLNMQGVEDFRDKLEKHRNTHRKMWKKKDCDEVSGDLRRFHDAKYTVMKKLGLGPAFGAVDMHFDTYIKAVQDARTEQMTGLISNSHLNGKVLSIVLNYLSNRQSDKEGFIVNMWLQNMFRGLFEGDNVMVDALR